MRINVDLTADDLKRLVIARFRELMPDLDVKPSDVFIETKSAQNYPAGWEVAVFRARVIRDA